MPEVKKPRPHFYAPKPPVPLTDAPVVANAGPDTPPANPLIEAEVDTPVMDEPTPAPALPKPDGAGGPTIPGPRLVSRAKPDAATSPLDAALKETDHTFTPKDTEAALSAPPDKKPPPPVTSINKPQPPVEEMPPKSSSANFILVIITLFALVLAATGWFMYFSSTGKLNITIPDLTQSTPIPTPTSAPQPLTTAPAKLTHQQMTTLEVLNGSGVPGQASLVAGKLQTLGYQIVKTGNADNQKYLKTVVTTSKDYPFEPDLLKDLVTFGPATISGTLTDSTPSARIIIGKDWIK